MNGGNNLCENLSTLPAGVTTLHCATLAIRSPTTRTLPACTTDASLSPIHLAGSVCHSDSSFLTTIKPPPQKTELRGLFSWSSGDFIKKSSSSRKKHFISAFDARTLFRSVAFMASALEIRLFSVGTSRGGAEFLASADYLHNLRVSAEFRFEATLYSFFSSEFFPPVALFRENP